ncbi:MAG: phenylacetic acid degradation protein [Sneathiella sp.]|jgi:uncharacterized protein (TIGR00369 family)|uniref:PaaI family thioesterase n=1 Tax=Sneathiella sp. TaxID=1964365 RepID=UPI000C4CD104|nr:PaaI family thioesterase [Sneathiella sp.]MAL80184.1 phenylacetic acid degradation protein [Sneathiella sp.]|tara:strand:- start:737 stop:1150 length:414 start_codon:yes stop_codon:yes gene_type:complete
MSGITKEQAQNHFDNNFNSWIREMGLTIEEIRPDFVSMRMPVSEKVIRTGGMICGQAIMALGDTAMVFAVAASVGRFVPMTTVNMQTSFLRAAMGDEMFCDVRIVKRGKRLVYGDMNLHMGDPEVTAAHATTSVMLL